jgi:hypothetical protein
MSSRHGAAWHIGLQCMGGRIPERVQYGVQAMAAHACGLLPEHVTMANSQVQGPTGMWPHVLPHPKGSCANSHDKNTTPSHMCGPPAWAHHGSMI